MGKQDEFENSQDDRGNYGMEATDAGNGGTGTTGVGECNAGIPGAGAAGTGDVSRRDVPTLYMVIPCYNEERTLPVTKGLFLGELKSLVDAGRVSPESRVMLVDDGSSDSTWEVIKGLAAGDARFTGVRLSRNRGHQNALLAGLMEAMPLCDATVSMDCDGQDDVNAVGAMLDAYMDGCEVVYGVRNDRATDTPFKRATAEGFYRLLSWMGADVVYNHADFRLVSSMALREFSRFGEVNLFLRGMFPLVGFKSGMVYYARAERVAGESHYPLSRMLGLAFDGITSLSVRPIRLVTALGALLTLAGVIVSVCCLASRFLGGAPGIAAVVICAALLTCGVQLICMGVLGEYIGKIYMETKHRPRYIISERT